MARKANLKGCKDAIMQIAGEVLTDEDAQAFVQALEHRIGNVNQANLENLDQRIARAGQELTADLTKIAILNKRNAILALNADSQLDKHVKPWASPTDGYLAYLDDSRRGDMEGAGKGVNALVEGYKAKYLGELKARLSKANLLDVFRKDLLTKEIFMEFYEPGSSGSADAKAIRDIMTALKQDAVIRQNLWGSYIHFLPEHVKRQTYSINLIKKNFGPERFKKKLNFQRYLTPDEYDQTFQQWADFIMPLLDHERTFKDEDKMLFLRGAFDGIMNGKRHGHMQSADGAEINVNFFKAGSLAKKASAQRLFHFKDGASAFAAHQMFSPEPLSKGFIVELEHAATNIALMQQLGPNPRGTLENHMKKTEYLYNRQGDEKKMRDLQAGRHRIMSALSYLDRSINIPENPTMQTVTASVISLLSQAKLGKLLFFALPDKALIQSVLTRNGIRGLDALGKALKLTKPSNKDERLRLMMLGGEIKSFINAVNTRFSTGSESGVPTAIFNSQKHFFNLTGINWMDDIGTDAIVGALPRHIGAMADRTFDELIPQMKQMFRTYDISSKEWDAWRSTVYSVDSNGQIKDGMHGHDIWITPDRFALIPDEVIDGLVTDRGLKPTTQNRARVRDQLEGKFRAWLIAQRDEGVLMPGSREHRLATFGTQSGTLAGSVARLVMMFKTFPITVYTKIMEREMHGNGARTFLDWIKAEKNSNFHTTQLIALSTIAGYLSLTIDELLQGKNPRKFTNSYGDIDTDASLKILKDSFLRGNSASIMGDLILREFDTGYDNIISQLGGPATSELIKASALASQAIRGEAKAKDAVEFLHRNLPWVNLFYIKPALDHLVWFNIQEMLDPGTLRERELKHKQEFNQDYWLAPSDVNEEIHN
jgi:hypothetical protein